MTNRRNAATSSDVFSGAFDASPVGILLGGLDGWPLFANPAFCAMVGLDQAEVLRTHWTNFSSPDDVAKEQDLFEQLRSGALDHYQLDKRYIRRDGSVCWGGLSVSLLDRQPAPIVVAIVQDITSHKLAHEELLRLALIVESTDDAVLSRSLNGLILSWNEGARRLFGYTEGDVIGRPIAMIVPNDLRADEDGILARVRAGEHIKRYETRRLTNAGTPIDVSVTISPIRNRQGEIIGACDVARDITERRRIERSLHWRLDFERILSDLSRTFISLPDEEIDADVERGLGRIGTFLDLDRITLYELTDADHSFSVRTNWTRSGIAASVPLATGWAPWWSARTMRGDVTLASRPDDLPAEATAERNYFQRAGILSAASIPLNVGGDITGAMAFVTVRRPMAWTDDLVAQLRVVGDVFSNALRRKRVMEELRASQAVTRESEERFRLAANAAPAMIWVAGPDMRCTYFNQTWLAFTGRSIDAETGHGWAELIHREDLTRVWNTYSSAFERREPFQMEYRMRRHDGVFRWLHDHGVPRFNLDGLFAGYIGSCVDVTDRKDAETMRTSFSRRLIQAQEEERAGVSRELHDDINQRVVLSALRLEAIRGSHEVPPAADREITRVVEQLGELASDIQALSHRLHSTKLAQLGIQVAAAGFCREVAAQHNIQVDFHSTGVPDGLRTDISLCLFRILQEALQNATKHSAAPKVDVSLVAAPDDIQLIVKDRGRGFHLADAAKGDGIGLANMHERVRLVRGTLAIETAPGRGTMLTARVPLGTRTSKTA